MTTSPSSADPTPTPRWLRYLVEQRVNSSYVLFGLSAVIATLTAWFGIYHHERYLSVVFYGVSLVLITLFAALWQILREPEPGEEPNASRTLVLGIGGLAGLATAFLGLGLCVQWWRPVFLVWLKGDKVEEWWRIPLALSLHWGGLAIMFASLQLGRTDTRTDPLMRRLLYGYNTVLVGLLLLEILAIGNVLGGTVFTEPLDFSESSMYTLAPRSKEILQGLEKPVQIYVVMTRDSAAGPQIRALVTSSRNVSDKIQLEFISPDLERERVRQLYTRYNVLGRDGLLVVMGTDEQADSQFIPLRDLYEETPEMDPTKKPLIQFKGEDALIGSIDFLSSGKSKSTIYFTQGQGELDLNDSSTQEPDRGLGILSRRLEERNLVVKPLKFGAGKNEVPEDAAVVVIAGPSRDFSESAIKSLDDYMNPAEGKKKGKLLVLLDLPYPTKNIVPELEELERFLAKFNVEAPNERVLSLATKDPLVVPVHVNLALANQNVIARAFQQVTFRFINARPVRPARTMPRGGATYFAEPLLASPMEYGIWPDRDLRKDASELTKLATRMREDPGELAKRMSQEPIILGVAVSERGERDSKGRMIVLGDATIASNEQVREQASNANFDLIASSIDWLRDRKSSIGIEPKKTNIYDLDKDLNYGRLFFLPGMLTLLGIVGMGTGVWLVRRR